MRLTKRLQRQRSRYGKGQPRHWLLPEWRNIPKYTPNQVLKAQQKLKEICAKANGIKVDYYIFRGL